MIAFFSVKSVANSTKNLTIIALTTTFVTYCYLEHKKNDNAQMKMFDKQPINNKIVIPNIIIVIFIYLLFSFLALHIMYKYKNQRTLLNTYTNLPSRFTVKSTQAQNTKDETTTFIKISIIYMRTIFSKCCVYLLYILCVGGIIALIISIYVVITIYRILKIHNECSEKTRKNTEYYNNLYESTNYIIKAIFGLNDKNEIAKKYHGTVNYSYNEDILWIFLSNTNYMVVFFLEKFYFSIYDNIIKYMLFILYKFLVLISLDLTSNTPNLKNTPKIITALLHNTNIENNLAEEKVFDNFTKNEHQFYKNIEFATMYHSTELMKVIEMFYKIQSKNDELTNIPISFIHAENNNIDIHEINKVFKEFKK